MTNDLSTNDSYTHELLRKIESIREELSRHDDLYYNLGKPEIEDSEYDLLVSRYHSLVKKLPEDCLLYTSDAADD